MSFGYPFEPRQHFGYGVTLGQVPGVYYHNQSCGHDNMPSPGEYVLQEGTDWTIDTFPFLAFGGEGVEVVSDNAADTGPLIQIEGLDGDGFQRTEIVTLNGTTPVSGVDETLNWYRVFEAQNVGPSKFAGNVFIRRASDSAILMQMTERAQKGFSGVYTNPVNYRTAPFNLIASLYKSGGSNTSNTLRLYGIPFGGVRILQFVTVLQRDGDPSPEFENTFPDTAGPLTDFVWTSEAESNGQGVFIRVPWLLQEI